MLDGARLGDVAAGLLRTARQGLQAALTGAGPFAGLFGTQGQERRDRAASSARSVFKALSGGGCFGLRRALRRWRQIAAGQWGIVGEQGAEVVAGPAAVTPLGQAAGPGGAPHYPGHQLQRDGARPARPSRAPSGRWRRCWPARSDAAGRNA